MIPERLIIYVVAFCALVGSYVAAYGFGHSNGAAKVQEEWDKDRASIALQTKTLEAAQAEKNTTEVIRYVDRVQTVEKRVPVVRDRIVQLCNGSANAGNPRVPSPGNLAAAAQADAGTGQLDGLAAELPDAKLNRLQCEALINVVRPQAVHTR